MSLPDTYTNKNETGCCPVPNIEAWDKQKILFENRHFVRMYTKSFIFMPLNMGKIMKELDDKVRQSGLSLPSEQTMILSRDLSPWKAEQLYSVSQPINGMDNVSLNGMFLTRVFEGPYKDAGKWHKAMQDYAKECSCEVKNTYFCYTTCPKCAKHYGKNYVIGLIEIV